MKKCYRYIILVMMLCVGINKSHSQISFALDTLKVSHVIWMSTKNVVITHFAYGPHLNMLFSIRNDGDDTITLNTKDLHLYIRSNCLGKKRHKEILLNSQDADIQLVIPPKSSYSFNETTELVASGELTENLNYRMTNFLPFLTKLLEDATFVLSLSELKELKAPIQNCYLTVPLFVDGTSNESIFSRR